MHEIYRMFATDMDRDRVREADRWRLARQVPRTDHLTLVGWARAVVARLFGQPAEAPARTLAADTSARGS